MEETPKDQEQKAQELVDVDDEGKPIENLEGEEDEDSEDITENGSLKPRKPKTCVAVLMVLFSLLIVLGGAYFIYYQYKRTKRFVVIIKDNENEIEEIAAEIIANVIKRKSNAALGLITGSTTAEGIYKKLIKKNQEREISFEAVSTYNIGEYVGFSRSNNESFYHYMNNHFFDYVDIKKENTHFPDVQTDVEKGRREYDNLLKNAKLDLQLIGVGTNGHIGFNEPGTSFNSTVQIVNLSDRVIKHFSRLFGGDPNKVPKLGVTLGIKNILSAEEIVVYASGRRKAEAIRALVKGDVDKNIPITALNTHKGKVYVLVDKEAASLL